MIVSSLLFALGLALLTAGGEALVRGATILGVRWGLSVAIIGLTVVAVATSAPELAVTADATLGGTPEIAIGNVLGSNVANLWLVLGAAALLRAFGVSHEALRRDMPVVLGVSVLFGLLALDGAVGRVDGAVLLVVMAVYLALCVRRDRQQPGTEPSEGDEDVPRRGPVVGLLLVVLGVGLLTVGADLLVTSASEIASSLGLSDLVIGLTIVAFGTSLPELTATVLAAWRRRGDLGVGNVLGSNIANLAFVVGLTALVLGDVDVPGSALRFDLPMSVAALLVVWLMGYISADLNRLEGAVLLAAYAAYVGWLVLDSTGSGAAPAYGWTVVVGAAGVVLVLVVVALRQRVRGHRLSAGPPSR